MSIKIWAFRDNRAECDRDDGIGKVIPLVCVVQIPDSRKYTSPWADKSVSMTPRQARLLAKQIEKAADYAESADDGNKFDDIKIS